MEENPKNNKIKQFFNEFIFEKSQIWSLRSHSAVEISSVLLPTRPNRSPGCPPQPPAADLLHLKTENYFFFK